MRSRPVVVISTVLALLGGGAAVGAEGDSADSPAAGASSSTLTLLDVGIGGTSLSVLELALRSDSLAGAPSTSFVVTPLSYDGTAYGRQSLASRSAVLPSVDTSALAPAAITALAAARSPLVDVTVDGGSSRAGTASLGSISILGMPLALTGEASLASLVDGSGARGGKTLTVTDLALPSVADLLAALGLDLTALPTGALTSLVDGLDLASPSTVLAEADLERALAGLPQLAPAQAAVAQADAQVRTATAAVDAARVALAPATTALNGATRALTGTTGVSRRGNLIGLDPLPAVPSLPAPGLPTVPLPVPVPGLVQDLVPAVESAPDAALDAVTTPVLAPVVDALPALPAVLPVPALPVDLPVSLQPVADAYTVAKQAYDNALQSVRNAEAALMTVTETLRQTVRTVEELLAPYQAQVDALVGAVTGLLDATPLLSLDRLEVSTRSAVTSAEAGGQVAEIVGGEVQGLRVLGTDVLQSAVGRSTVEVLDLTGPVQAKVDGTLTGLTGTLSDVLSQVPGLPALQVPAPKVELLSRATSTDVVDGFGLAGAALRALHVTWPGLTIPAAATLPGAGALPAVTGLSPLPSLPSLPSLPAGTALPSLPQLPSFPTLRKGSLVNAAGDVLSQPLSLSLATLEERARFRPTRASLLPGTSAPVNAAPAAGAPTAGAPMTGAPTAGAPTTGGPTTGTPTTGTPTTGTPITGAPGTGTPTTATPGGPTPPGIATGQQLPRTGLQSDPSVLALLLIAAALAVHRRSRTA